MDVSLKLRQLSHLVILAEELHFARAAERACLSQSAFSRSISGMEDETGMRLFDRGPHFVSPTAAGEHVIARARRLLSSSGDLAREIAMLRSGDLGKIAIGAGPFSGISLMPRALAQLRLLHPRVQCKLVISDASTLLQQLRDEKLDFFLAEMQGIPSSELLVVQPLGRLTGAFFCRSGHPLSRRTDLRMRDLADASFVSVHIPAKLRRTLGKLIAADEDGDLPIAMECESLAILREIVQATDVVLVATERAMQMELAAGTVQKLEVLELQVPSELTPLATEYGLVYLRDRTPTTASRILMDLVRTEAATTLTAAESGHMGRPHQ